MSDPKPNAPAPAAPTATNPFPDLDRRQHEQQVIREQVAAKKSDDLKKEENASAARTKEASDAQANAKQDEVQTRERRRAEDKAHEIHRLPTTDVLAFAVIDLQRGIDQLKQNSAANQPGTFVYTAIQYFEAAVLRLDGSLELERGGVEGKKLSPEERAKEHTRYEQEYRDHVYPEVVR